nr:TPA_asm: hypothetical protein [Stellipti virus 1]
MSSNTRVDSQNYKLNRTGNNSPSSDLSEVVGSSGVEDVCRSILRGFCVAASVARISKTNLQNYMNKLMKCGVRFEGVTDDDSTMLQRTVDVAGTLSEDTSIVLQRTAGTMGMLSVGVPGRNVLGFCVYKILRSIIITAAKSYAVDRIGVKLGLEKHLLESDKNFRTFLKRKCYKFVFGGDVMVGDCPISNVSAVIFSGCFRNAICDSIVMLGCICMRSVIDDLPTLSGAKNWLTRLIVLHAKGASMTVLLGISMLLFDAVWSIHLEKTKNNTKTIIDCSLSENSNNNYEKLHSVSSNFNVKIDESSLHESSDVSTVKTNKLMRINIDNSDIEFDRDNFVAKLQQFDLRSINYIFADYYQINLTNCNSLINNDHEGSGGIVKFQPKRLCVDCSIKCDEPHNRVLNIILSLSVEQYESVKMCENLKKIICCSVDGLSFHHDVLFVYASEFVKSNDYYVALYSIVFNEPFKTIWRKNLLGGKWCQVFLVYSTITDNCCGVISTKLDITDKLKQSDTKTPHMNVLLSDYQAGVSESELNFSATVSNIIYYNGSIKEEELHSLEDSNPQFELRNIRRITSDNDHTITYILNKMHRRTVSSHCLSKRTLNLSSRGPSMDDGTQFMIHLMPVYERHDVRRLLSTLELQYDKLLTKDFEFFSMANFMSYVVRMLVDSHRSIDNLFNWIYNSDLLHYLSFNNNFTDHFAIFEHCVYYVSPREFLIKMYGMGIKTVFITYHEDILCAYVDNYTCPTTKMSSVLRGEFIDFYFVGAGGKVYTSRRDVYLNWCHLQSQFGFNGIACTKELIKADGSLKSYRIDMFEGNSEFTSEMLKSDNRLMLVGNVFNSKTGCYKTAAVELNRGEFNKMEAVCVTEFDKNGKDSYKSFVQFFKNYQYRVVVSSTSNLKVDPVLANDDKGCVDMLYRYFSNKLTKPSLFENFKRIVKQVANCNSPLYGNDQYYQRALTVDLDEVFMNLRYSRHCQEVVLLDMCHVTFAVDDVVCPHSFGVADHLLNDYEAVLTNANKLLITFNDIIDNNVEISSYIYYDINGEIFIDADMFEEMGVARSELCAYLKTFYMCNKNMVKIKFDGKSVFTTTASCERYGWNGDAINLLKQDLNGDGVVSAIDLNLVSFPFRAIFYKLRTSVREFVIKNYHSLDIAVFKKYILPEGVNNESGSIINNEVVHDVTHRPVINDVESNANREPVTFDNIVGGTTDIPAGAINLLEFNNFKKCLSSVLDINASVAMEKPTVDESFLIEFYTTLYARQKYYNEALDLMSNLLGNKEWRHYIRREVKKCHNVGNMLFSPKIVPVSCATIVTKIIQDYVSYLVVNINVLTRKHVDFKNNVDGQIKFLRKFDPHTIKYYYVDLLKDCLVTINDIMSDFDSIGDYREFENRFITSDALGTFHSLQQWIGLARRCDVWSSFDPTTVCFVQGVAGCGKTTFLKDVASEFKSTLILTATKENALELEAYGALTVTAFLQNYDTHNRPDVLIIDEACLLHPGLLICIISYVGAINSILVGDKYQIPFILRDTMLEEVKYDLFDLPVRTILSNHSYRIPCDVASIVEAVYGCINTQNKILRSLDVAVSSNVINMFKSRNYIDHVILTFTQSSKNLLHQLSGRKVLTIHEAQGMTYKNVILVRTEVHDFPLMLPKGDLINSWMLVALTRHTHSFTYLSPKVDFLAKVIRNAKARSDLTLSKYYCNSPNDYSMLLSNLRRNYSVNCSDFRITRVRTEQSDFESMKLNYCDLVKIKSKAEAFVKMKDIFLKSNSKSCGTFNYDMPHASIKLESEIMAFHSIDKMSIKVNNSLITYNHVKLTDSNLYANATTKIINSVKTYNKFTYSNMFNITVDTKLLPAERLNRKLTGLFFRESWSLNEFTDDGFSKLLDKYIKFLIKSLVPELSGLKLNGCFRSMGREHTFKRLDLSNKTLANCIKEVDSWKIWYVKGDYNLSLYLIDGSKPIKVMINEDYILGLLGLILCKCNNSSIESNLQSRFYLPDSKIFESVITIPKSVIYDNLAFEPTFVVRRTKVVNMRTDCWYLALRQLFDMYFDDYYKILIEFGMTTNDMPFLVSLLKKFCQYCNLTLHGKDEYIPKSVLISHENLASLKSYDHVIYVLLANNHMLRVTDEHANFYVAFDNRKKTNDVFEPVDSFTAILKPISYNGRKVGPLCDKIDDTKIGMSQVDSCANIYGGLAMGDDVPLYVNSVLMQNYNYPDDLIVKNDLDIDVIAVNAAYNDTICCDYRMDDVYPRFIEDNWVSDPIVAPGVMYNEIDLNKRKIFHNIIVKPKLNTAYYGDLPNDAATLIRAVTKRNLHPPKLQEFTDADLYSDLYVTKFLKAYVREDVDISIFNKHPIVCNDKVLLSWLKALPGDKINALLNHYDSIDKIHCHKYEMHLKRTPKAMGTDKFNSEIPKGQVIAAIHKTLNAYFSPIFRVVLTRLLAILKPNVLIGTRVTIDDVEIILNNRVSLDRNYFYELDMSGFDKSVNASLFACFEKVILLLGVTDDDVKLWRNIHGKTFAVSRNQVKLWRDYQTISGDSATALMNTILNMIICIDTFKLCEFGMFFGDDSLMINKNDISLSAELSVNIAKCFNMDVKITKNVNVGYFCGYFILNDGIRWKGLADIIKRIEKLGSTSYRDVDHILELGKSYGDLFKSYGSIMHNYKLACHLRNIYNTNVNYEYILEQCYKLHLNPTVILQFFEVTCN